jgi:predicted GH43/DUF377 family glycosyl hydrolase
VISRFPGETSCLTMAWAVMDLVISGSRGLGLTLPDRHAIAILVAARAVPPILTRHGWLIVYHGVSEVGEPSNAGNQLCYSAGVMVLSKEYPRVIRYRSAEPMLTPVLPQERRGTIANVVFPTGIDRRDDLGSPDRFDIYYGMADDRIGVARLDVPDLLPPGGVADPPDAKV